MGVVLGGTFAGAWGGRLIGAIGIPIGIALGFTFVAGSILLVAGFIGLALARLLFSEVAAEH
jgi:hypothetical protein